jgi:DNA ligase D-like protein (predicted polymerase)
VADQVVEVDGRQLKVSNLDKVLYPATGFTKAEVIDYYVRVAPAMLPHVADRGVTLRRYPNGVDETSFFEKRCPSHRPEWIGTFAGPGDRNGTIGYCALDSVAALAWSANMAALEIHAPMARGADIESPTMCVFDLDPGPGTGIPECAEVALHIREVLDSLAGLECLAKTSGSKGLQVYVPLNAPHTHEHCSEFALAVGSPRQGLHRLEPEQPPQDDRRPLLAAGPTAPDRLHPGGVGRGRGGRRRCVPHLRGARGAGPARRARRPLRRHPHGRAAAAGAGLTPQKARQNRVDPRAGGVGRSDSPVPANQRPMEDTTT